MPRTSKWAGNNEMWEWCAALRRGGVSYSDIHGRLTSAENKRRFGLVEIPSPDAIRYQVRQQDLLALEAASVLPPDELDAHRKALSYLALLTRQSLEPLPPVRPLSLESLRSLAWNGFADEPPSRPTAHTDDEQEIRDEWNRNVMDPRDSSSYRYLEEHLDSTGHGRRALTLLNRYFDRVETFQESLAWLIRRLRMERESLQKTQEQADDSVDRLVVFLDPLGSRITRHSSRDTAAVQLPELYGISEELSAELDSPEQVRSLRSTSFGISQLIVEIKHSLSPISAVRKMVQRGSCEICARV